VIRRWGQYVLLAMIALAVWRAFKGDLGSIALAGWSIVETGADAVTDVWNALTG
jgi:hypothetical protein